MTAQEQVATTDTSPREPEPGKGATPEEIERDIERTREQLGHTVDALAAKADVKTRAQHRARRLREEQPQVLYGAAAAGVVLVVAVGYLLWRRRG